MVVAGVGGVGGLTNQWNPVVCNPSDSTVAACCNTAANDAGAYCFHDGIAWGLTIFATVILVLWTLPLAIGSLFASISRCEPIEDALGVRVADGDGVEASWRALIRNMFLSVIAMLNCLWFAVPVTTLLSDSFYRTDISHVILAIAIAAAFPLSWNLSLVAVPATDFLSPLLQIPVQELKQFHKTTGWCTVCWAVLHATGEFIYLAVNSDRVFSISDAFDLAQSGENLLYLFGFVTLSLTSLHAVVAAVRHRTHWLKRWFGCIHRTMAACLLLTAAAHWWPFAFFLVPASAVQATAISLKMLKCTLLTAQPAIIGLALSCSLLGNAFGVTGIWALRARYMSAADASMYVAFIFPPLATSMGFIAAFFMSQMVLRMHAVRQHDDCNSLSVHISNSVNQHLVDS